MAQRSRERVWCHMRRQVGGAGRQGGCHPRAVGGSPRCSRAALKVKAVFHDEVRDTERQVRPDYGVSVGGAITGYMEVKAPGRGINPAQFKGHDLRQWERQRDLPNLLYTNGTEWRLYRD